MDLGWCDVCLKVKSAAQSRAFYEDLGFHRVEGEDAEGWAVVTNGELRLGLYEESHVGDSSVTLNFRGGDVAAITQSLAAKGHTFKSGPTLVEGGGSATLLDPDGYPLFFDTAPGEVKTE